MAKIVFKTTQFPVQSETFITNQIVAAIEMGHDVSIIVSKKNKITSSTQQELIKKYDLLSKTYEINDQRPRNWLRMYQKALCLAIKSYPIKYLKTFNFFKFKKQGLSGRLFYDMTAMHSLLDADIFHVQFGAYAEPFISLKKHHLIQGKLITTFLGLDAHFNEDNIDEVKRKYKSLFLFGDYFTTITEYIGGQVKALGCPKEKLEIIPLGIDIREFKPLLIREERTVIKLISVGRLIQWKGHELGIRAVDELVKKGYPVHYDIIGEGEEKENLEQLIRELNLEDIVSLLGVRGQKYIKEAMQQSDIFLMTSTHDETGRRETQGVVTGEAQACGLPVCAFDSGGVRYTLVDGKTGFLSKENDYLDMAANIEKLIVNPELKKKMAVRARQFVVENYSLEISAAKMQAVYQKLLKPGLAST